MNAIEWRYLAFDQLNVRQIYAMLQLRCEVFVVEQACIFQDLDGADAQAMHLLGSLPSGLVAYARCFQAGIKFPEASIGRVVIRAAARGSGAGHATMKKAIDCLQQAWGAQAIRIGAQAHLAAFYHQHGFEKSGPVYQEDGIDHIEMLRLSHF